MSVFPVLADLKATLQNWSPKLSQLFQQLQNDDKRYRLNEEVETGETWINGRKIYRKVIDFGALPAGGTKNVPHHIASYSTIIKVWGFTDDNGGIIYPLPYVPQLATFGITVEVRQENIRILDALNYSAWNATVIIEYVK